LNAGVNHPEKSQPWSSLIAYKFGLILMQVNRLTDQRLDTLRYIGIRPDTGLVFSGDSKLVERVLLELFRQCVAGARNFILLAAVARPLRCAFHSKLDNVVEYLCSAIAGTTKINSTNFTDDRYWTQSKKAGKYNKNIRTHIYTVTR